MFKILKIISQHKILAGIIVLLIIVGGYFGYKAFFANKSSIRYVFAQVQKGTLITSISGSGQVSASNQVDIKSKASGDIIYIGVKNGQEVKAGTLIAQLDTTDAQKLVRDAEINLQNAEISLEQSKTTEDNTNGLDRNYQQGLNEVEAMLNDSSGIINNLNEALFDDSINGNSKSNLDIYMFYTNQGLLQNPGNNIYYNSYQAAKNSYEKNFNDYQNITRTSNKSSIESFVDETYQTTKLISEAIKKSYNIIYLYKKNILGQGVAINPSIDTYLSNLNSDGSKINNHLISLSDIKDTIKNDPLSIQSKELALEQKQNALLDAKNTLSNYYIYAPFDGIIATLDVRVGDSLTSASTITTLITKQKIAEISLNEVDIAKIKTGQKTTLTFDALSDLSITGEVAEIDSIGTTSQGVVTYNVKIAFDTQDERIKPGMSVTAAIITDTKQDVLLVPNSAIKSTGNTHYVETFNNIIPSDKFLASITSSTGISSKTPPLQQSVETGSSNDSFIEITDGLKEGDIIVVRTINSSSGSQNQQSQNQSLFQSIGGGETRRSTVPTR